MIQLIRDLLTKPATTRGRISRNLILKTTADVVPRSLAFVVVVMAARLLDPEHFGTFVYGLAIASVLAVMVDFGWNAVVMRRLASGEIGTAVNAIFRLKLASAVFLLVLQQLLSLFVEFRIPSLALSMLLVATLTFSFQDTMGAISSGKEHFEWEVVIKIIPRVILLAGFSIFLFIPSSLTAICLYFMVANLVGFVLSALWFLKRIPEWKTPASMADILTLAREAVPFGIIGSLWILYIRQDIIILGFFSIPQEELSYYATASKVLEIGRLIPLIVQMSLVPVFLSFASEPQRLERYSFKMLKLMLPGFVLLTGVFYFGSGPIIQVLFGQSFIPAHKPLQIAGAAMGLTLLNVPLMAACVALKMEKRLMISIVLALLTNAVANLLFIPRFSYLGPAWALLVSEAVWFGSNAVILTSGVRRLEKQGARLPGH